MKSLRQHFAQCFDRGRFPLLMLGLMLSLPFLNPHHRNPIPSFFPEWWAAAFGLAATGWLLALPPERRLCLPRIALLPAALGLLIFAQLALLPAAKFEMSLLAVLYLLWTISLLLLGSTLAAVHGPARLADTMAAGILLGALLSSLVVGLQWSGAISNEDWISARVGDRLFGNLNQPNHLALQLWLGIAALLYLQTRRQVGTAAAAAATVLLVFASLLSGSRALWLYAGGLVVLALLLRRQLPGSRSLLPGAGLALFTTAVGKALLPLLTGLGGPIAWVQSASDGVRGGLWWLGARMGSDNPWLGIGWGHFASASFARIEHYRALAPASLSLVPGEHAHNITLNLFAELGVLAPLCLLAGLAWWLWRLGRREITPATAFGLALLLLLGLHAQLEYTLWYTYFLGIAALALALADPQPFSLRPLRRSLLGLVLAAALAALLSFRHDYGRLEQAMSWRSSGQPQDNRRWEGVLAELLDLRRRSQFGRYVDLTMIGAMPLNREALPDKLLLCRHGIAFSPADYVVFKCAALQALNGDGELARQQFGLALASYPLKAGTVAKELSLLSKTFPELEPLSALAQASARPAGQ